MCATSHSGAEAPRPCASEVTAGSTSCRYRERAAGALCRPYKRLAIKNGPAISVSPTAVQLAKVIVSSSLSIIVVSHARGTQFAGRYLPVMCARSHRERALSNIRSSPPTGPSWPLNTIRAAGAHRSASDRRTQGGSATW
jgi:hypothetical protein